MAEKKVLAKVTKEPKHDTVKTEANNNSITTKARYWVGIGWIENLRGDWQDVIGGLLQYPYTYVVHDKDVDSEGKPIPPHVHIMIAYGNTTTYKSALELFRTLNAPGKQAFNTCFKVQNVRHMYNYLVHDTDDARKKKKYQYPEDERVCGNNFEIGLFEQISQADKERMLDELEDLIFEKGFCTYGSLTLYVKYHMTPEHRRLMRSYSSHLERLVRSNYIERFDPNYNKERTI